MASTYADWHSANDGLYADRFEQRLLSPFRRMTRRGTADRLRGSVCRTMLMVVMVAVLAARWCCDVGDAQRSFRAARPDDVVLALRGGGRR